MCVALRGIRDGVHCTLQTHGWDGVAWDRGMKDLVKRGSANRCIFEMVSKRAAEVDMDEM